MNTVIALIHELTRIDAPWILQDKNGESIYALYVLGYLICLTRTDYCDGYTIQFKIVYEDSERSTEDLYMFLTVVKYPNYTTLDSLNDTEVESEERTALIKLLAKLEKSFYEKSKTLDNILLRLKAINKFKENI